MTLRILATLLVFWIGTASAQESFVQADGAVVMEMSGAVYCRPSRAEQLAKILVLDNGIRKNAGSVNVMFEAEIQLEKKFQLMSPVYSWGMSTNESDPVDKSLPVSIEISANSCESLVLHVDLNEVPMQNGVFKVALGDVHLECNRSNGRKAER